MRAAVAAIAEAAGPSVAEMLLRHKTGLWDIPQPGSTFLKS